MHPDFNPKFRHLKPFIVFFTHFTKDAQPAAMQAARWEGEEWENGGGDVLEEKEEFSFRV